MSTLQQTLGLLARNTAIAEAVPESDDDAVLSAAQHARLQILAKLTSDDDYLSDPKKLDSVLKVIDGASRQSLTIKRISADEGISGNNSRIMSSIVDMFCDKNKMDVYREQLASAVAVTGRSIEVPDDENVTTVEGEMEIGIRQMDYATFMDTVAVGLASLDDEESEA